MPRLPLPGFFFLLPVILGAAPPLLPQAAAAPPALAGLERRCAEFLETRRRERGFPGATLGFVLADGRAAAVAAGLADVERNQAMTAADRMLSGSIGKTYVAAVTLQLAAEGKLGLDDPLERWLGAEPWFSALPNAAALTVRHLLRHTSGIPEHVYYREFWQAVQREPDKVWKPEELVAYVAGKEALFAPGASWSYADTNYILVGMIVERAAPGGYYQELGKRLLEPLGLRDTGPSDRRELPGLVPGYPRLMRELMGSPDKTIEGGRLFVNPQLEWTGGGLYATSLDLARWTRFLFDDPRVIPAALKADMRDGVAARGRGERYGLGVQMWSSPHGPVLGHGGWFPGYLSEMGWFEEHRLAVAVQFNTDDLAQVGSPRDYLVAAAAMLLAE